MMKIISPAIVMATLITICYGAAPRNIAPGKLHVPHGEAVTVAGVIVEGPYKGYQGGPNLRVQKIQGKATQQDIQIVIRCDTDLKIGGTYELDGFTTGTYVGGSPEPLAQTTARYFREEFAVSRARSIKPIVFAPGMFPAERALIQGKAETKQGKSVMTGDGWSVVVKGAPWPEHAEGKEVETFGVYKPHSDPTVFDLVDGEWRLVRLKDQLGRDVKLRGTARNLNNDWWFHYRGGDVRVENMAQLPGWENVQHWQPIEIRGRLESDGGFIVKRARWSTLPFLLSPERPFNEPQ